MLFVDLRGSGTEEMTPEAYVCIPESTVTVVTKCNDWWHIRLQIDDPAAQSKLGRLKQQVLNDWYGMTHVAAEEWLSMIVPVGTFVYDADKPTQWFPVTSIRVGDRIAANATLRRAGHHTILDAYQIVTYDCDCLIAPMQRLLEGDNAIPHDHVGPGN